MLVVGTSGWSYDDWVGPVYPKRMPRSGWLAHYARTFATVEVNSTFYQLPLRRVVEGWVETVDGLGRFEYSLKLPRSVTHDAIPRGDHAAIRDGIEAFRDRIAPIGEADRLGAVLVQLAPRVQAGGDSYATLATALEALGPVGDVAVEFRHRSWVDGDGLDAEAADLLGQHAAAACIVDGPGFPTLPGPPCDHAYVRLHGRRRDAWFDATDIGDHVRYDYLYDDEELGTWADRIRDIEGDHERVRVYFNNHPDGQAFRNADRLRQMLDLSRPDRPATGQRSLDAF